MRVIRATGVSSPARTAVAIIAAVVRGSLDPLLTGFEERLLQSVKLLDHMPDGISHGLDRSGVQLQIKVVLHIAAIARVAGFAPLVASFLEEFQARSFFE